MKIVFTLALVIQALPLFVLAQQEPLQQGTPKSTNYPQMKSTGDLQADEANWLKAKDEWIRNYPDEYRALGGVVSLTSIENTQQQSVQNPIVNQSFTAQTIYLLEKVEAVPIDANTLSSEEKNALDESLCAEYAAGKAQLQIGSNHQIRLWADGKMDMRATQTRSGQQLQWFIDNKECAACSKTLYLSVEQETEQTSVILMKGEDENDAFVYRFTFRILSNYKK